MVSTSSTKTTLTRFATALLLTLVLADLYPHPRLAPGFVSSWLNQVSSQSKM